MILQLNPPIPVHITDKGLGYAIALIDYSQEHNLHWVVSLNDSGEIWTVDNTKVRLQYNYTLGRMPSSDNQNQEYRGIYSRPAAGFAGT